MSRQKNEKLTYPQLSGRNVGVQMFNIQKRPYPLGNPTKKEFPEKNAYVMSVNCAILVPSTVDEVVPISEQQFKRRIMTTIKFINSTFGGSTAQVGFGTYKLNKRNNIGETVGVVSFNTNVSDYNKFDANIKSFLNEKKQTWRQKSMGFRLNGKLYFI